MSTLDLSAEQLSALKEDVVLLEACPGSGKTRTIVQRFKKTASESNRGVALLSFTNAAVDEASSRCADQPGLLKSPNFVGTFDSFIHRYIVTPILTSTLGKAPTYVESWASLSVPTTKRLWGQEGRGIDLSSFHHDVQGRIFLDTDSLQRKQESYFLGLKTDGDRRKLEQQCVDMICGLNEKGIFDCDSARAKALAILRSDQGESLLLRLSRRFQEVMIDEFQDCSSIEHEIIKLLAASGIHVLVVADPDQAIYEFRGATAELYSGYRSLTPETSRRALVENYRSTPPICELLTSIRTGRKTVVSAGSFIKPTPTHIFLIVGSGDRLGSRFRKLADEWTIEPNERIALAHSATDARKLGSGVAAAPTGVALATRILVSLGHLRQKRSPSDRRKTVIKLETALLSVFDWPEHLLNEDNQVKIAHLGKEPKWLRLVIGRLVHESKKWTDAATCKASMVLLLEQEFSSHTVGLGRSSIKQKLSQVRPDAWAFWSASKTSGIDNETLQWSTIHGAKGNEYDAVLLEVPSKAAEEAWVSDLASEEKRVFYVGASRARKLLAIATPKSRLKSLKSNLDDFGVKYVVLA